MLLTAVRQRPWIQKTNSRLYRSFHSASPTTGFYSFMEHTHFRVVIICTYTYKHIYMYMYIYIHINSLSIEGSIVQRTMASTVALLHISLTHEQRHKHIYLHIYMNIYIYIYISMQMYKLSLTDMQGHVPLHEPKPFRNVFGSTW